MAWEYILSQATNTCTVYTRGRVDVVGTCQQQIAVSAAPITLVRLTGSNAPPSHAIKTASNSCCLLLR